MESNITINEEWKQIPFAYEGYKVSNMGRVMIPKGVNKKYPNGIIKGPSDFVIDKDGYYRVTYKDKNLRNVFQVVHRLVALAFIPNSDINKKQVNHKDANRLNNCLYNLEWVTPKENVHHSYLFGNRHKCVEVPRVSKLTPFQVSQIDELRLYYSLAHIAKLYNIEYQSIKNIVIKQNRRKKQFEILDNQQPSIYTDIYEGSTTISNESTPKLEETPCPILIGEDIV